MSRHSRFQPRQSTSLVSRHDAYWTVEHTDWAKLMSEFINTITPPIDAFTSTESLFAFFYIQELAGDPKRHFIRILDDSSDAGFSLSEDGLQSPLLSKIGGEEKIFILTLDKRTDKQHATESLNISLMITEKNTGIKHCLPQKAVDSTQITCDVKLSLTLNFTPRGVTHIHLEALTLDATLQDQQLLQPLAMAALNPLSTVISRATIHCRTANVAPIKIIRFADWQSWLAKQHITTTDTGALVHKAGGSSATLTCRCKVIDALEHHNQALSHLIKAKTDPALDEAASAATDKVIDMILQLINPAELLASLKLNHAKGISTANTNAIQRIQRLASDPKRLLISAPKESADDQGENFTQGLLEQHQANWLSANASDWLNVLEVYKNPNNKITLHFYVANKAALTEHYPLTYCIHDKDPTTTDCALVFSCVIQANPDTALLDSIYISDRAVDSSLQGHDIMRRLSVNLLSSLQPICDQNTQLANTSLHPATWLFMSETLEEYNQRKQHIKEVTQSQSDDNDWTLCESTVNLNSVLAVQSQCLAKNDNRSIRAMHRFIGVTEHLLLTDAAAPIAEVRAPVPT